MTWTEFLGFTNVMFLMLIFIYAGLIKNINDKQDKLYYLFLHYKPQRKYFDEIYILNLFYSKVMFKTLCRFGDSDKIVKINRKMYRNLEFCSAEMIINLLIDYMVYESKKNHKYMVITKVKFAKFIESYSKMFDIEEVDDYMFFLGERVIMNLLSIEGDIFNAYQALQKVIDKINLNQLSFSQGVKSLIEKNRLVYNNYSEIKISKNEIYNFYKQELKKVDGRSYH
jgi:hypothetical protein